MTTEKRDNRQVVFENEDWYKKDTDKEQDFTGIIEKVDSTTIPTKGGVGPQVTIFYQLVPYTGVKIPVTPIPLYTHGTTNSTLEKYLNWEVKMVGKLTKEQLWCGFFNPLKNMANPGGPISTFPVKSLIVFENADWYKGDKDKEREFHGVLQKADTASFPTQGGHGPVVTHFYQLEPITGVKLPVHPILIYSHAEHSDVLDSHIGWECQILGKLTNNQLWPGTLLPIKNTINPGGPIQPVPEPEELLVFANEDWYKKDSDKVQEWTGTLEKYSEVNITSGGGPGPVVTLFYQLKVYFKPPIILEEIIPIFSHAQHNKVLDKYLNHMVRISGKLTSSNGGIAQIWPGYLTPLYTNPGGPIQPASSSSSTTTTTGAAEPGKRPHHQGLPIELVVFADQEWYRKDKDRVQEWTGTLLPYQEFNIPPGGGPGPVVTLFYKLSVYFRPPIILSEELVVYSDKTKNNVLDSFLNKTVRLIGKLVDGQIWPGFAMPWSPSQNLPASTEDTSRRVTVFANETTYKKDESATEEWRGKLVKYDEFPNFPTTGGGVGPVVTLFYQLAIEYAPQLPIINKIIYSDNSRNDTLDKYLNQEVLITGKLINKTEIYPGYLTPLLNIPAH